MDEVFFPQLTTGCSVQYPIVKERTLRTIRNVMRDGRLISLPDTGASLLTWNLEYAGLSQVDSAALKATFDACSGPLLPFTFIDPTGNAVKWSSDFTNSVWERTPLVNIAGAANDPFGDVSAYVIVNNGQSFGEITQTLNVPSNYQFCFSIYSLLDGDESITLIRRGANTESQTVVPLNGNWNRVQSQGQLNDGGGILTIGVRLAPGQRITVFGPQLEPQRQSSPYRATANLSAVFTDCFWATQALAITADGPNSYSALLSFETTI